MDSYGYIYKTINTLTGKFYIGYKAYKHRLKKKLTKKELALIKGKGRKPTYKYVEKDSGYENYYGSSKELLADIEKYGKENFKVEIIGQCTDKIDCRYWEMHYQFLLDVLFKDTYNSNIAGSFYRGRIKDLKITNE